MLAICCIVAAWCMISEPHYSAYWCELPFMKMHASLITSHLLTLQLVLDYLMWKLCYYIRVYQNDLYFQLCYQCLQPDNIFF